MLLNSKLTMKIFLMTFLIWLAESRPKNQDDPRTELENVSNSLLQKVILLKSVFLRFESGHEFKWFLTKKTGLSLVNQIGQSIGGLFSWWGKSCLDFDLRKN